MKQIMDLEKINTWTGIMIFKILNGWYRMIKLENLQIT